MTIKGGFKNGLWNGIEGYGIKYIFLPNPLYTVKSNKLMNKKFWTLFLFKRFCGSPMFGKSQLRYGPVF